MQTTLFQVGTRCRITSENGLLVLTSPYIPQLVDAVKSLPYTERRYDTNRKTWLVDPKHGPSLVTWVRQYAGEVVSLPQIAPANTTPVMRLLEIRYLGACKARDDGSVMAFGLVGQDWSVIVPETVLRAWFDASDSQSPPTAVSNLYQLLGTKKTATADEIKSAYRRMARQWHPDVCHEANANEVFLRIQEAYTLLSDANRRARYDAGLVLEAAFNRQNKQNKDQAAAQSGYRSPLRCGMLLVEGFEKLGRVEVTKILAWEDIVKNGKTLVTSWPAGAKEPVEAWV